MSRTASIIMMLASSIFALGCVSPGLRVSGLSRDVVPFASESGLEPLSRVRTQSASMKVEVANPMKSASKVETLTASAGGYVESSSADEEDSVRLSLRIPTQECDRLLDEFGSLGKLKHKTVDVKDVTEDMVDAQARVENLTASRDRLRQQLEHTNNVEEVLAVERELTRVQSELESLEARLKVMNDEVAYSKVSLSLERKVIYGPIGYIGNAMMWGFEKLFVLNGHD